MPERPAMTDAEREATEEIFGHLNNAPCMMRAEYASAMLATLRAASYAAGVADTLARVRAEYIERVQPDDEIVSHGMTHIERLTDGTLYLMTGGEVFTIYAEKRRVLRWFPRDREWESLTTLDQLVEGIEKLNAERREPQDRRHRLTGAAR